MTKHRLSPKWRNMPPEVCAGTKSVRAVGASVQSGTETIRVFLEFKMRCVGCPIACFHTVDDACREHGVDRDAFFRALAACA
jgi:hybrid cluster-associated redox disulfide protein